MLTKRLSLAASVAAGCLLASCAEQPRVYSTASSKTGLRRMSHVRTTAYTRGEAGGRRNAIGKSLSAKHCLSAASDWSRFPLGTRFRIVGTNDEYIIDDYGTALIGTNTVDLYKPSRLEMKRWGVRHVDIDILQWGSDEQSIKVLAPRAKHRTPRRILLALVNKKKSSQLADQSL